MFQVAGKHCSTVAVHEDGEEEDVEAEGMHFITLKLQEILSLLSSGNSHFLERILIFLFRRISWSYPAKCLPLDPVHHTDLRSTLQKQQAGERGEGGYEEKGEEELWDLSVLVEGKYLHGDY